jgi:Protein of unknown function (DUF1207)
MKRLLFLAILLCLTPTLSHSADGPVSSAAAVEGSDLFNPFPAGFPIAPDQPEGWRVLPPGRPFPSLPSDPRDLKIGLRKNNHGELEADIGGYRSVAGWKGEISGAPTVFHTGIEGNAYFQMSQAGSRFPLNSSDGLIGLYAEAVRGLWMYQARYTHISAHIADGLFNVRSRIYYSREFLVLRAARQLDWVRAYAGLQVLTHTIPAMPRLGGQLGAYAILPWHWMRWHPYAGADLRLRSAQEGTTYQLGFGAALDSSLGAPPLRLVANYLKGHDLRGQFYNEPLEKWAFGFELDF